MTAPKQKSTRQQLRQAVYDCRERGLSEAATWAAQQLVGLPKPEREDAVSCSADNDESDVFLHAKSLFDTKVRNVRPGVSNL